MSSVVTEFPDQTYTTSNKPSVETLKSDISALETGHNDLESTAVKLTGTQSITGQKTFTSPILESPIVKAWDGWQLYSAVTPTTGTFDSPSFPIVFAGVDLTTTLYPGMRVKITQSTVKYFIVTAVSFSTDTTVTLYGGTDYSLVASGTTAISAFSYSTAKAPSGFPLDPTKWTAQATDTTERAQATPVSGTWYNIGSFSLTIPIGIWDVQYQINGGANENSATGYMWATLSTANNSESDIDFTTLSYLSTSGTQAVCLQELSRRKVLVLAAKTTYYINCKVDTANIDQIRINTAITPKTSKGIIRAICAYL